MFDLVSLSFLLNFKYFILQQFITVDFSEEIYSFYFHVLSYIKGFSYFKIFYIIFLLL